MSEYRLIECDSCKKQIKIPTEDDRIRNVFSYCYAITLQVNTVYVNKHLCFECLPPINKESEQSPYPSLEVAERLWEILESAL